MKYRIEQYTDRINAYFENDCFLKVDVKYNLSGTISSKYYHDDVLILETMYEVAFFRLNIDIVFQGSKDIVTIEKIKNKIYMKANCDSFTLRRNYFKNPIYILLKNDLPVANVSTMLNGISFEPRVFNVEFKQDEISYFYCLLYFLIVLPPLMETW